MIDYTASFSLKCYIIVGICVDMWKVCLPLTFYFIWIAIFIFYLYVKCSPPFFLLALHFSIYLHLYFTSFFQFYVFEIIKQRIFISHNYIFVFTYLLIIMYLFSVLFGILCFIFLHLYLFYICYSIFFTFFYVMQQRPALFLQPRKKSLN